jgi:hypothetical protein
MISIHLVRSNAHGVVLIRQVLDNRRSRVLVIKRDQSSRSFGEPLETIVWGCILYGRIINKNIITNKKFVLSQT